MRSDALFFSHVAAALVLCCSAGRLARAGRVNHGARKTQDLGSLGLVHECKGNKSEIVLYTVSKADGKAKVDRNNCIDRFSLDYKPTHSYAILTMVSDGYFEHLKQNLLALKKVPQTGGLPVKIIVGDVGLKEGQAKALQDASPVPMEIHQYKDKMKALDKIDDIPGVPKKLPYEHGGVGSGAPYRLKAIMIDEWYKKLNGVADQLLYLDAGGIVLGSLHRLRNFVASEGFYAGSLAESAMSAMFADSGNAPADVQNARRADMKQKGHLPTCFDYESENLVDKTHSWNHGQADKNFQKEEKQLGSFEGGFLAADLHHPWVKTLLGNWANVMEDKKLWAENYGYYFAFDQKILTNEIWKAAACGKDADTVRILDVDNVRFGSVAQYGYQPYKDHFSFFQGEKIPWAGYAYHYCMKAGDQEIVRHPCMENHPSYPPDGWQQFAALEGDVKATNAPGQTDTKKGSFLNMRSASQADTTATSKQTREDCDAEIPSYDLTKWAEEHPDGTLPDHPAVFTGYDNPVKWEGLKEFLSQNGDEKLTFFPEYGQPGGFGAQFPNHDVHDTPLKEAIQSWNTTRSYSSTFNCKESKLCQKLLPRLATPKLFDGKSSSINFLIGGPGSGLPLHEHGKTWQGLHAGRKAWYLVPPGAMTLELAELTNPFLMPVNAWNKVVEGKPLGKRPLRCVQHAGEIMYFPDRWFHGTLNLDEFQLAWGAKPENRPQQDKSASFLEIKKNFPDSEVEQAMLPYCLDMKFAFFERGCSKNTTEAFGQLDTPLSKLKAKWSQQGADNPALSNTLAFAYCALAAKADGIEPGRCPADVRSSATARWRKEAAAVSSKVAQTECNAK